jgi:glycosyltransferase involved in cell wall biosynthesis
MSEQVIWVHRFPEKKLNAGVFMYNIFLMLQKEHPNILKIYSCLTFQSFLKLFLKSWNGNNKIIFHAQYGSLTGFQVLFLKGEKVLTLRGSDFFIIKYGSLFEKIHSRFSVFLTYISLIGYDKIIVMSNDMKKRIPKYFIKKTFVLPDSIDYDKFYPQPQKKYFFRKKYFNQYVLDAKLILFVSIDLTNPIKRYQLAIDSVNLANKKVGFNKFVLVTASNIEHAYMHEVMNAVDLCLLTSSHEGWPNCIKEAIATNIPFVATDVSDLKNLISNMYCNCFISNDNVDDLSNALLKVNFNRSFDLRNLLTDFSYSNYSYNIFKIYKTIKP